MSKIIKPGAGIIYMKVGTHAQETLDDIISRKTKEIEQTGFAFWGYGGGTCHPETMVQPFAKDYAERGQTIYLCMQEMESKHFAYPVRADEYSIDGIRWETIPATINVLGSRYALAIKDLQKEDLELPLDATKVALGNSIGAIGSNYIRGKVDKACLEVGVESAEGESHSGGTEKILHIGLVAKVVPPYAVYVRNSVK